MVENNLISNYLSFDSFLIFNLEFFCINFAILAAVTVSIWFNPIYSLLSLILVFLFSLLYLSFLKVKFLSIVYLLVYVGAIIILFLFVIMMLSLEAIFYNLSKEYWLLLTLFFLIKGSIFSFFIIEFGFERYSIFYFRQITLEWAYSNIFLENIYFSNDSLLFNNLLYTQYSFLFVLLGFILLIGMVASISITNIQRNR
jgi:NADH:ubiquinone oxidoreductase subunit 6 (subunit J)